MTRKKAAQGRLFHLETPRGKHRTNWSPRCKDSVGASLLANGFTSSIGVKRFASKLAPTTTKKPPKGGFSVSYPGISP